TASPTGPRPGQRRARTERCGPVCRSRGLAPPRTWSVGPAAEIVDLRRDRRSGSTIWPLAYDLGASGEGGGADHGSGGMVSALRGSAVRCKASVSGVLQGDSSSSVGGRWTFDGACPIVGLCLVL